MTRKTLPYKSYIQGIKPYEPGKPISDVKRELGLKDIIKLASNENALGPSPKAVKALAKALRQMHLYPDGSSHDLKKRLLKKHRLKTGSIVLGNGSNEIIELLIRGFVGEGDKVITSEKSFLVYPLVTRVAGGECVEAPMKNYRYDLDAIYHKIDQKTKIIFIANPNNPTGTYVTRKELEGFISRVPKHILICLDEAYFDFAEARDCPDGMSYVQMNQKNVIALRTFSKSYGLAGLRIGYGAAHPELITYLEKIRQPFNLNLAAQVAALAALDDHDYLKKTLAQNRNGKKYLQDRLDRLQLEWVPSQANFLLVNAGVDADILFQKMLRQGVIVRSMKAYRLNHYIRVTIGKESQNRKFIVALRRELRSLTSHKGR